ncbi:hypothetical protein KJA13_01515 [Patescibacteria group bacterium]|nr:hypothetical protein [Patescibacteria group bacterium]
MKKLILFGAIAVFLMASIGTVVAKGPYNPNAIDKNPNLNDFSEIWPTALDLQTNLDGDFVQWFHNRHYICQCTDGMNPDAIASKLSEGWFIWHPATDDPRYEWCSNHEYIIKMI